MFLPPNVARRFQLIMKFAWKFLYFSKRELLAWAGINPTRRNAVNRIVEGGHARLTIAEARGCIDAVAPKLDLGITADEIWWWIIGETTHVHPAIRLMLVSKVHEPIPESLHRFQQQLSDVESRARQTVLCSVVPLLSALNEDGEAAAHRHCFGPLGNTGKRMISAHRQLYKIRKQARESGAHAQQRRTHLNLASNLLHIKNGTGWCVSLTAEKRANMLVEYADDTIRSHHESVGVIRDDVRPLSPDLQAHVRRLDGIFVTDNEYVMLVHKGGLRRTTCLRDARDPFHAEHILHARSVLDRLENCVTHSRTSTAEYDQLMHFMPV